MEDRLVRKERQRQQATIGLPVQTTPVHASHQPHGGHHVRLDIPFTHGGHGQKPESGSAGGNVSSSAGPDTHVVNEQMELQRLAGLGGRKDSDDDHHNNNIVWPETVSQVLVLKHSLLSSLFHSSCFLVCLTGPAD